MKVLVSASSFSCEKAKELAKSKNIELVFNPFSRRLTENEISELIPDFDGLLAGLEPLNTNVLKRAKKLKAIARIGVGTDNVDFAAAKSLNIKVSNTPDAPTEAVAEMTVSALLSILHRIIPSNEIIHNGEWKKIMGSSIKGLNVLIIGYGRIGRKTAELLMKFGCNILAYDPFQKEYSSKDLKELLGKSDVISIHASGEKEILTSELFSFIKSGCIILNSARGKLINEEALFEAIQRGKVSWFWGDALWTEPYVGDLVKCKNAILTPHIATYTVDCRNDMEYQAMSNLIKDLGM
ncbi:MAG: NAD(P)-dependent oxidoreductase [Bacilli bacterium]